MSLLDQNLNILKKGNGYIVQYTCSAAYASNNEADTQFNIDVKSAEILGRNSCRGALQAWDKNTSNISVAFSHNGTDFTGFWVLAPGQAINLDGRDIAKIRVRADVKDDGMQVDVY
jgi:hypothetical protein